MHSRPRKTELGRFDPTQATNVTNPPLTNHRSLDQKDRERETAIANKTQEHQTALEILSEKMARDSELIQHHEAKGFSFIEQIKGKH